MNSSRRQFLARTAAGAALVAGGSFAASPAIAQTQSLGTRVTALGTRITALTDVTVIDVKNGRRDKHLTVLISGDRIIGVGRVPVPRGATELNLPGKFVIPGLADMHVHSLGDEHVSPPLYLANGLTTVREMAAPDPAVYDWRDRIDAGTLLGPRMVVASQIIDGDPTLWDPNLLHVLVVWDETGAQAAVRQVKAEGAPRYAGCSRRSRSRPGTTDTGTPYMVPGFALHEELELLVGAGATPRQALYAATMEPARFLGLSNELGSIEPRKIADLVVLDADPLTDIRNTRRINTVVTRGRIISPAQRQKMLADVEAAVKQPPSATALAAGGCCGSTRPA
jgi:hypothetical protein